MSTSDALRMAAVIGTAVVAGLLAVQGTWALWDAAAASGARSVQAADFRVELNGSPMTAGGVSATVALQNPAMALTPTNPVYAAVTLTNATNAGGPFRILAAAGTPSATSSTPGLAATISVQTAPAPAAGGCLAATYSATPASTVVAKGGSVTLCLRASLPADAPSMLGGSAVAIAVPITATQLPEGA